MGWMPLPPALSRAKMVTLFSIGDSVPWPDHWQGAVVAVVVRQLVIVERVALDLTIDR